MNKLLCSLCCLFLFLSGGWAQNLKLENAYLSRQISVSPYLHTNQVENKKNNCRLMVPSPLEFMLRFSEGTDKVGTDFWLSSKDFNVKDHAYYALKDHGKGLKVSLENIAHNIRVDVHYELPNNKPYIYKYLNIQSDKKLTLERIDIDAVYMEGAYQPYKEKEITANANGHWRPGLGQPLYNYINATYWGVEFPASTNTVVDQDMKLGYLWGKELTPSKTYTTYKSVMGVADDVNFIDDAFFDYIDDIRIRPLRFRLQYNTWFDLEYEVDEKGFLESSKLIHKELVEKRGVKPFDAYVVDDGWQDNLLPNFDKEGEVWVTNSKFSKDFEKSHKELHKLGSQLGIWISPSSIFRAVPQTDVLRSKGYEALSIGMSMTGEKYMKKFEDRILKLTKQGVNYFKFDGLFGHLIIRGFELNGRGAPAMPQLDTKGFVADDIRLNNTIYDELKVYYLVAGTERLMQLMKHQHEVNPEVYTAITNGAYLSPWWLQYTDAVWLINCGDAAGGASRNDELVYRDGVYYEAFHNEHTKFPLHSVWNHEPKKVKTGEPADTFRDYLFMHLSRGTGFLELYIKPSELSASDWDVMAEGIKWVQTIFPTFRNARMYGGNPRLREVYGYSGWNKQKGYISMHNPSNKVQKITVTLDRKLGVGTDMKDFLLSSPIKGDAEGLKKKWSYGDTISITLQPKEIRILTFDEVTVNAKK